MTSYKYISPINNSSTLTDNEAAILIAECFTCCRKTLTKIVAEIFMDQGTSKKFDAFKKYNYCTLFTF